METKDNIDRVEFTRWITQNINLILNNKETKLFRTMEMSFEDIKLFGKDNKLRNYYNLYQNRFQTAQFNWIMNY